MIRKTIFNESRTHRFTLWREFDLANPSYVQFIGLNPSTADETKNDNTVTRCINFAKAWGYGALCMTNIFAYRATDPKVMKAHADPIGTENDTWLAYIAAGAGAVVCAWGADGTHLNRADAVTRMLADIRAENLQGLQCLGLTKHGHPRHPLYIKGITPLRAFAPHQLTQD